MAVLLREADYATYHEALLAIAPLMSVATTVEIASVSLRKFGSPGLARARRVLDDYEIVFSPVDDLQTSIALDALADYGRGRRRPPAILNYGDLFSYALAKARDLPMLYKGDDFA